METVIIPADSPPAVLTHSASSVIYNHTHTHTQHKPSQEQSCLPDRTQTHHQLTCWSSHSISTAFWPALGRHGSRMGGAWVVVGTVVGWNTWVVVAGVGGRGRRGMFRDEALSEVPGGLGQVKGQGRQVTPNPAVTLAALAHNPIPLAVLATVAMETGTAGAWICKKLHPIKTTRMRDEIRIILSNIWNRSSHTEQQRTIPRSFQANIYRLTIPWPEEWELRLINNLKSQTSTL